METGRHDGRGRAKHPKTGYLSLDRSRRKKIFSALILDRPIDPADEPYARDRAQRAASKLPHALVTGIACSLWVVGGWSSLFPLTGGTLALLVLVPVAGAIYLAGLIFGIRMWLWLKRR